MHEVLLYLSSLLFFTSMISYEQKSVLQARGECSLQRSPSFFFFFFGGGEEGGHIEPIAEVHGEYVKVMAFVSLPSLI